MMRLDRIERNEEVLINVILCDEDPELNDTSLACRTVDVSGQGMQVVSDLPIPVSSKLGLRLDLSSILYRLEAEVRWARDDDTHHVGLLLDSESPDYKSWMRMFELEFFNTPQFATATA